MSPEETGDHLRVSYDNKIRTDTKLGRWKSSISGRLVSWPQIKKSMFLSVVFSYSSQQWTISQLNCDMRWEWILYDDWWQPAQWLDGEEAPEHFPKSNLLPKKGSWSLFDGLLAVWSITAFWILAKPVHLWSMLSESMRCTKNCNICRWHSSPRQCLTACYTSSASKAEWIGLWSFASSAIFTWLLANWLLLPSGNSTTFCRENAFQEFVKFQNKDFYATRINKLISPWQKCVDCNGSYFD